MERKIGEFRVRSDAGHEFVVCEFAEVIRFAHMHGSKKVVSDVKTLRTAEGYEVSPQEDGSFLILDLDLIVHPVGVH